MGILAKRTYAVTRLRVNRLTFEKAKLSYFATLTGRQVRCNCRTTKFNFRGHMQNVKKMQKGISSIKFLPVDRPTLTIGIAVCLRTRPFSECQSTDRPKSILLETRLAKTANIRRKKLTVFCRVVRVIHDDRYKTAKIKWISRGEYCRER